MLETLREYALEQLKEEGEFEQMQNWHACFALRRAEAGQIGLRGPEQLVWLVRLAAAQDNYRTTIQWLILRAREGARIANVPLYLRKASRENKVKSGWTASSPKDTPVKGLLAVEVCLRIVAALRPYWEWQGYLAEGREWLGAALALPLADGVERSVLAARAKALSEAARLVCLQNDQQRALELAEESIALWKQLHDAKGLAGALLHRGWIAHAMGEYETAKRVYQEGLDCLSSQGAPWLYGELLFHLGGAAGFTSDYERMRSCYAESRQLFEQVGDKSALADVWKDQGALSILEGNYNEAIDCLLKGIRLSYEMNHKQFMATGLGSLSFAVGLRDEPDARQASIRSARLGGAAAGLMDAIGLNPWTRTDPMVYAARQYIRSKTDQQSFDEAWAEGKVLTLDQAIELAYRLGEVEHS